MKKGLLITAAAAGYLVIQAFLFLLYYWNSFRGLELAVLVSTLGLIAALVYGSRPSPAKALTIVCSVIGFLLILFGPVLLVEYVSHLYGLPETALPEMFTVLVWAVAVTVVVKVSRKLRKRRVLREAEHWLAERAKYAHNRALWHKRERTRRLALWLPSAVVLLVLFFWAPVTGFLSQVCHPGRDSLGRYRVRIPVTWAVYHSENGPWGQYVAAWKLRGMARSAIFLSPKPPLISTMSFRATSTNLEPDFGQRPIRGNSHPTKQSLRFDDVSATCWEYPPESPAASGVWWVRCLVTSAGQNQAVRTSFNGSQADIPVLYETISRIRFAK